MSAARPAPMPRPVAAGWRGALPAVGLVAGAIGGGLGLAALAGRPILAAAALGAVAGVVALRMLARAFGGPVLWVGACLIAIQAGELSSLALGGQSGKLLWADAVIGAGVCVALARRRLTLEVPRAPHLDVLWPLLGWCALTLLFASDPLTAIAEFKEWLAAAALGVGAVIAAGDDARRARLLLVAVALTAALTGAAMIGVALTSPLGAPIAIMKKLVDLPWGRTNYLAGLIILGVPVVLGLLGDARSWRGRLACLALLLPAVGGLAVSASKGAMVSLVAALALSFGIARRQARAPRLIMLAAIAAAAALYVAGPLKAVSEMRLQDSALEYSAGERVDLYVLAWNQFLRHPVFGVGLNLFSVISHRLHGLDTVPHNYELGFLAELGLPGVIMAVAWMWAVGAGARRAIRAARTPGERSLALGLWAGYLGFVLHNQFESTIYGQQYKMLLFVFAGAAWALARAWEQRAATRDAASSESAPATPAGLPDAQAA